MLETGDEAALLPLPRHANHFIWWCGSFYLPPPINYQLHAWPELISLRASSRRHFNNKPADRPCSPAQRERKARTKKHRVTLSFVFLLFFFFCIFLSSRWRTAAHFMSSLLWHSCPSAWRRCDKISNHVILSICVIRQLQECFNEKKKRRKCCCCPGYNQNAPNSLLAALHR